MSTERCWSHAKSTSPRRRAVTAGNAPRACSKRPHSLFRAATRAGRPRRLAPPATVFVATARLGGEPPAMDWAAVGRLAEAGFRFGSAGASGRPLVDLSTEEAVR